MNFFDYYHAASGRRPVRLAVIDGGRSLPAAKLARYRWSHSHSVWIRHPMPPRIVLENQPELPALMRPQR